MSITIDGTTGISGVAGTAGTPAVQGEDTNTGVFFPAADTVAIATNGVERMRVVNGFFGGYVGINTTTPSAALNVASVGTSNVPVATGAVMRIEQGPFGYSETVLQIAAGDQSYGGGAILFGVGALANSSRIASFGPGDSNGLLIQENSGGPITLSTSGGQAVRVTSTGNFQFNSGYGSVATAYGCRAWVNFNGTNGAIRGSGGVSSVTYNGVGTSTVNFTTAMPDTNYSAVCSGHGAGFSRQANAFPNYLGYATGSINVWYGNTINAAAENLTTINVAVFR